MQVHAPFAQGAGKLGTVGVHRGVVVVIIRQLQVIDLVRKLVHFEDNSESFLSAAELSGFDDMQITVCGNEERILLVSRFDNLGKGASGSAVQNINIALGTEETLGLNLKYK